MFLWNNCVLWIPWLSLPYPCPASSLCFSFLFTSAGVYTSLHSFPSLSLSLSDSLLSVCLFVCLPACLPACLRAVCPSVCLSICLSVCLSVWMPACLPACLSVSLCRNKKRREEVEHGKQGIEQGMQGANCFHRKIIHEVNAHSTQMMATQC